MTLEVYLSYLVTAVLLVMVPGPVVGVVVAVGGTRGASGAMAVTAGASLSIALQLTAAAFGLDSRCCWAARPSDWRRCGGDGTRPIVRPRGAVRRRLGSAAWTS